jgi:hypothetical protein
MLRDSRLGQQRPEAAMNKLLAACIGSALACGIVGMASAQTTAARNEISTAHTHAKFAAEAATVAVSHVHLHHVINCLVGPTGTGFDATQANPCKGQGNGAIPDSASDHALHAKLESVLSAAEAALKTDTLASAHRDAAKIAADLQAAAGAKVDDPPN